MGSRHDGGIQIEPFNEDLPCFSGKAWPWVYVMVIASTAIAIAGPGSCASGSSDVAGLVRAIFFGP